MTRPALVTTESGWAALQHDVRDLSIGIKDTSTWINKRIQTYNDASDEAEQRSDQPGQRKDTAMSEDELREQQDSALIEQLAAEDRELEEEYAARERDRAVELDT